MLEKKVPLTLMTGFLESGKTTAVMQILKNHMVELDGATLIIDMEEDGETVYEDSFLQSHNVVLVKADDPNQVTASFLQELYEAYTPDRVFVEYNGTFKVSHFESLNLPKGWQIERQMTLVDGSCFALYMRNLKPMFLDMVKNAQLVLFNRCLDTMPLEEFAAIVREANDQADIVFEQEQGGILCIL